VFTWGDPGGEGAAVATVTLDDLGDRTRMTFRLDGVDGAPGDDSYYDGWDSALDVLAEHVA